VAAIVMDLHGIELAKVAALGGADTITVGDLTGTDLTGLTADLAGSLGGSDGDGAQDTVIATGTGGDDTMSLSGSSGAALLFGLHTTIGALNAEPGDQLTINTGAGSDQLDQSGFLPGTMQVTFN
jgi:hypothetical protein